MVQETCEQKATRDAYGHALLALMSEHKDIVVLDADLSRSTRTEWIARDFPNRFLNIGIAEQNMFGIAAGLAAAGFIPFTTTYAIFIGRGFDQIRQSVCFADLPVKIVATHAGLAASYDGGSHQGIEDIALMRAIPGMAVISPADYNETVGAVRAAYAHPGPVYLRLSKEPSPTLPSGPFNFGKLRVLTKGNDFAIFATGTVVAEALEATRLLERNGVTACVVAVSTIKPLDAPSVRSIAEECGTVVTIEEHNVIGGLRDAVAAALLEAERPIPRRMIAIGLQDRFGETGSWQELRQLHGLTAERIARCLIRRTPDAG